MSRRTHAGSALRRNTAEGALLRSIFGGAAPESAAVIFRREAEAKLRASGTLPQPGTPAEQMPVLPLPDEHGDLYATRAVWRYVAGESAEDAIFAHAGSGMAVDEPSSYSLVWEMDYAQQVVAAPGYSREAYEALARDRVEWARTKERMAAERKREAAASRRHLAANKEELYQLFHPFYESCLGELVMMTAQQAKACNIEQAKKDGVEGEYVWMTLSGISH